MLFVTLLLCIIPIVIDFTRASAGFCGPIRKNISMYTVLGVYIQVCHVWSCLSFCENSLDHLKTQSTLFAYGILLRCVFTTTSKIVEVSAPFNKRRVEDKPLEHQVIHLLDMVISHA